jgi:large subunit ribosomal protein L28
MGRKCQITGKRFVVGHKVSHSNIKTLRRHRLNLQSKRVWDPLQKKWIRITATTRALRQIDRKGASSVLAHLIK